MTIQHRLRLLPIANYDYLFTDDSSPCVPRLMYGVAWMAISECVTMVLERTDRWHANALRGFLNIILYVLCVSVSCQRPTHV